VLCALHDSANALNSKFIGLRPIGRSSVTGNYEYTPIQPIIAQVSEVQLQNLRSQNRGLYSYVDLNPLSNTDLNGLVTTNNFRHACKVLAIDPIDASRALHDAKNAAGLGGADNCIFDLENGDIIHNGECIGNLHD